MNDVVNNFINHKSERSFLSKPIANEILDDIIKSAYRAPTSANTQQVSVIVTTDTDNKNKIAALAGGQPWIIQAPVFLTFVFDMHKTKLGLEVEDYVQIAHQSLESIVSGCIDVGIALASAMATARSFGLGVVPIGGIRINPEEVINHLQLPELTFPVVGLAIGYVDEPAHLKPRLPIDSFVHDEKYDNSGFIDIIPNYNDEILNHWKNIGRSDGDTWSTSIAGYYKRIYFPDVLPAFIKQGFGVNK